MKTNRTQMVAELETLMSEASPADAIMGDAIAQAFDAVRFFGAGVSEGRGISDAGLPFETILRMVSFRLPYYMSDECWAWLDANA